MVVVDIVVEEFGKNFGDVKLSNGAEVVSGLFRIDCGDSQF